MLLLIWGNGRELLITLARQMPPDKKVKTVQVNMRELWQSWHFETHL